MKNLVLVLTSIVSLALGLFLIIHEPSHLKFTTLSQRIEQDLSTAQIQKFFSQKTSDLSQIQIVIHTKNKIWKEKILKSIILPFESSSTGKYSLQIDAIENFTPEPEAILILQFNLFENSTKNKIWESSRIYHLDSNELNEFIEKQKN